MSQRESVVNRNIGYGFGQNLLSSWSAVANTLSQQPMPISIFSVPTWKTVTPHSEERKLKWKYGCKMLQGCLGRKIGKCEVMPSSFWRFEHILEGARPHFCLVTSPRNAPFGAMKQISMNCIRHHSFSGSCRRDLND